jgi:excisionase family DNA binding protein
VRSSTSKLTPREIREAFAEDTGAAWPVILSPSQLANLVGLSTKTIYEWLTKGRLDGAYRKRGKHVLIWRDRAIQILFSGKEWDHA